LKLPPNGQTNSRHSELELTYWERVALTRWGTYLTEVESRAVLLGHGLFSAPAEAVDIGCEGGRWSRMLAERGWSLTCLDVDAGALQYCSSRLPQAICLQVDQDATTFPVGDESADLLLCMQVPPVIQSEWFIPECHRVLRPGGVVVGVFFNGCSARGLAGRLKSAILGSYNYYRGSYPAWRQQVLAIGFTIQHEEGYCWFPVPRTSDSMVIPWLVGVERALCLNRLPYFSPWVAFVMRKSG